MSFLAIAEEMHAAGVEPLAIDSFAGHYRQLCDGETGLIYEREIAHVTLLRDADALGDEHAAQGRRHLANAVSIKLNGGLGTGMGMLGPKSLVPVRGEETFLDLIAAQSVASRVPLVLMNSFATEQASCEALEKYPKVAPALPSGFLQHRVPKLDQRTLLPVRGCAPELAWCPPGHGDLYTALQTSGVLSKLLAAGRRYAFVSNADNLGATLSLKLLGAFVASGQSLWMEVADRTHSDRKGGHLATRDGRLILREAAQCPPEEVALFQDITRHRYFNTNNIWLDLQALADHMARHGGIALPMIRNAKTVDPRDPASTPVYQLESAMGAAISVLEDTGAIRVPRSRFSPVKTTADLLVVRSDAYIRDAAHRLSLHPSRGGVPPKVTLDPAFYAHVDQLDARIPVAPSLIDCHSLELIGDVRFEANVTVRGDARVVCGEGASRLVSAGSVV